ncbi:acyltransferase [Burkholderia diffusa]|uniref:acyltransferase n=1 Tax=Burkholderia diffusa TaxID=488732 RepID=UPI00158B83A1|nr:acyltransferase [Burkholderia diffusa]
MNKLLLRKQDRSLVEVNEIPGVKVQFIGNDSTVTISESSLFKNVTLRLAPKSMVDIGTPYKWGINNLVVEMGGAGIRKSLKIGNGVSISSATLMMQNESDLSIEIGDDCLFSSGVVIRPGDGHRIFDAETGILLNRTQKVVLERKVWIGSGVTILKGVHLQPETIVGSQSLVTRGHYPPNIAMGGNPAKEIRRGVKWSFDFLPTD